MSDEEIFNKLLALRKRKLYCVTTLHSSNQILNQLALMEADLLSEYNDRQFIKKWNEVKEVANKPIETDSGIVEDEQKNKGYSDRFKEPGETKNVSPVSKSWAKKFSSS